jgi:NAD(P)-dependent dehydrogenase (short-subunit alcohol dehydrogenase family)
VTDAEAWEAVVESVMDRHHRLDALANVAGIVSDRDSLLDQDEEGWERLVAVDLKGPWLGMKAVVPRMLEAGGGKVVNVASTAGLIGMPNTLAYSAAKGGVIAMSRQVAIEYAARGIRVNTIAPGVTQTPMLGDITEELLGMVTAATPAGRLGTPEDPARMIVYLLGAGGDFVTGQVIPIDGGWTAQ